MRSISFNIIFCFLISILLGNAFVESKYNLILLFLVVPILFIINFYLKPDSVFVLFSLFSFFPLIIPVGGINEMPIIYLLSPLLFIFVLHKILIKKENIFLKEINIFYFGIFILCILLIFSYIRNPIGIDMKNKLLLKDYFLPLTGVLIFFTNVLFFKSKFINEDRFLRFMYIFCLLLGFLRVLTYFLNYNLPFFSSGFLYVERGASIGVSIVHRIGGIDLCCMLGVSALFAYFSNKKSNMLFYYLLVFFLLAIIGGGRTLFLGLILLTCVYLSIYDKKRFLILLFIFIIILPIFLYYPIHGAFFDQFKRIFKLKGLFLQDPFRLESFRYYWKIFLEHPLLGKGIGIYKGYLSPEYAIFVDKQLASGGHGAYLSILAILGIGGLLFLLIFLLGGVWRSYMLLKSSVLENNFKFFDKLAMFCFIYLILISIGNIAGGSGFNNLTLYYLVGMLCGITLRRSKNGEQGHEKDFICRSSGIHKSC